MLLSVSKCQSVSAVSGQRVSVCVSQCQQMAVNGQRVSVSGQRVSVHSQRMSISGQTHSKPTSVISKIVWLCNQRLLVS